jgi:hypothetical protein
MPGVLVMGPVAVLVAVGGPVAMWLGRRIGVLAVTPAGPFDDCR